MMSFCKRREYRIEIFLNVAGRLIGLSDEGCIIAFEDPSPGEDVLLRDKGRADLPWRIRFTPTEYAIIKRLLIESGQIVPFEELALLLICQEQQQKYRTLASHVYRLKKKLPASIYLHCETGNGYVLFILPKSLTSS